MSIDVETLPSSVQQMAIAGSLDAADGVGFGILGTLSVTILDAGGETLLRYDVADATTETAFVFGELYHRGEQWKFRAVGQGWDSGLAGLATDYGISVAPDAAAPIDATTVAAENDDPCADVPDPRVITAVGNPDYSPVLAPSALDRPVAPSADDVSTIGPVKRTRVAGVQTRKARPKPVALPALALAGGPNWSAARLFSIYAVGTLDEQEKRATSALLSTVMAVREFGRALISRLGGPAGTIETYQEVSFKLNDHTVSPDGVIRVARGAKVWTALLETKTGSNTLRPGQIDAYLDLAATKGYDAVVTLSNEIALVGGEHPAGIDRRRVRKVALQHISWSEVLHEAQMQLLHRGIDDRLQAWVLAELIRYLEHPRSGAAGFDDMGGGWVPVREAVHAGMLRPNNARIVDVVQAWDKLMQHMGMRLTSQLGVSATVVISRQKAADAGARAAEAIAKLVADGTLQAQLRIQQSVGALTVTADLRSNRIRVSVDVDAPREGGASRRVNWLLRQLKDAPEQVTVEVIFARKDTTSCELLKDVRETNLPLLPDPSAEVRLFRLTDNYPLGSRRNGIKSAFIPSVNAAVDAFYANVVQGLRPWTKPAAKLPPEVAEEAAETIESMDQETAADPVESPQSA